MASAVVIMLVLTWGGNRYLWLSPTIIAMVGAAIALMLTFVWHAGNADEPFLPLSLMRGTVAPYAMAAGGCAYGAMLGLTVHLPLYYEAVFHLSASEAGLALIPLAAVSTAGAAIAGQTMARAKHYKLVAIIGPLAAAAMGAALTLTTPPLWLMLVMLSVFALGLGTVFPVSVVALQNAVARSQIGTVTGAIEFLPRADGPPSWWPHSAHSADGAGQRYFAEWRSAWADRFDNRQPICWPLSATSSAPQPCCSPVRPLFMTLMEERPLAGPAKPPTVAME